MGHYYVYILFNHSRTLYVGVTNDLERHTSIVAAIRREKQIKGWVRAEKISLIEAMNPGWEDLAKTLVVSPVNPPYTEPAGRLIDGNASKGAGPHVRG